MPADDRSPGWELRDYLAQLCVISEVQRPAREQWQLLEQAQRQLRSRQKA